MNTIQVEMKVFELKINTEKEWICAKTNIQALQFYCSLTGVDLVEFEDDDEIKEVPKEKWDDIKFRDADGGDAVSVLELMKTQTEPGILGGTMYD